VLRILRLFKYLAKFIPDLSSRTTNLRNLTRNDTSFEWTVQHQNELNDLLRTITSDPILAVYDSAKPVVIQTDASKNGLGCVILQNGHPISFASRTLTKSEQKWAQIEKELLAIVFACERFHYYVYGREFLVESDHKPLEVLLSRDIDSVTMRLQRMLLYLLKYPKMSVKYKPGRDMLVADCLSRAQLPDESDIPELANVIHIISQAACFSQENYECYLRVLENDENYWKIAEFVKNGWPSFHKLNQFGQNFYKFKSELHFENGLLFRAGRLVIPSKLQKSISNQVHESHLGVEKTLARARKLYYWPDMSVQIKELVHSCEVCEQFRRNNQKEPLIDDETPEYPFHMAGMDFFDYRGNNFLSIFDAYSNFLIVSRLKGKSVANVIEELRKTFDNYGYPSKLKCDNNPFNSFSFRNFANECNTLLQFSSPRYPQSNGLAEKGVAIAKNILKRCSKATDYQLRILEYNATPVASLGLAPCELFFGRMCKTKMPIKKSELLRNHIEEEKIIKRFGHKKAKQKAYYNMPSKKLCVH